MIPAQEIIPIPFMDKVGGSSSLIISSILLSNSLISFWMVECNVNKHVSSNSNMSLHSPTVFLASSLILRNLA